MAATKRAHRQNFYIFGHNISHSLSPTIHNTAFKHYGLPHHYSIHETVNIDESNVDLLNSNDFGGASVTFPHKLRIQPHLAHLSESAKKMGAVNTVIVEQSIRGRILWGDNTDWLGIMKCIKRGQVNMSTGAMVIGAGGAARAAAFALQQLGYIHIVLVNRTRSTAEKLRADFPTLTIEIRTSVKEVTESVGVIVACVPADDFTESDFPTRMFTPGAGVVVEMSYRPPVSALMRVAQQQNKWTVFGGVDVLKEQAYAQFELWTGLKAPVDAIEDALTAEMANKRAKGLRVELPNTVLDQEGLEVGDNYRSYSK